MAPAAARCSSPSEPQGGAPERPFAAICFASFCRRWPPRSAHARRPAGAPAAARCRSARLRCLARLRARCPQPAEAPFAPPPPACAIAAATLCTGGGPCSAVGALLPHRVGAAALAGQLRLCGCALPLSPRPAPPRPSQPAPLSAARCPLPAARCPLCCPMSDARSPLPAVRCPMSAVCEPCFRSAQC